jgi:hypothetical protein
MFSKFQSLFILNINSCDQMQYRNIEKYYAAKMLLKEAKLKRNR